MSPEQLFSISLKAPDYAVRGVSVPLKGELSQLGLAPPPTRVVVEVREISGPREEKLEVITRPLSKLYEVAWKPEKVGSYQVVAKAYLPLPVNFLLATTKASPVTVGYSEQPPPRLPPVLPITWELWVDQSGNLWWVDPKNAAAAYAAGLHVATIEEASRPGIYNEWKPPVVSQPPTPTSARTGPEGQPLIQDGFGRWGYLAGEWPNEYMVYV